MHSRLFVAYKAKLDRDSYKVIKATLKEEQSMYFRAASENAKKYTSFESKEWEIHSQVTFNLIFLIFVINILHVFHEIQNYQLKMIFNFNISMFLLYYFSLD